MRNRRKTRGNNRIKEIIENKKFRKIVLILLIVILICSIFLVGRKVNDKIELSKQKKELEAETERIFSAIDETLSNNNTSTEDSSDQVIKKVSVSAVGDILCGTEMLNDANTNGVYDFSTMFTNVKEYTNKSDITIGTLETNFISNQNYSGVKKYNAPISFLTAIKDTGIDLVSLAHNHILDYGTSGLEETANTIQNNNIGVTGIENKMVDGTTFSGNIKEINGIKIAFLAYTYGLSNESELSDEEISSANIYSESKATKEIEYAKANSNYIIVIMHWGDVNSSIVTAEQKNIENLLVNNGVDMILGSHPAVVETMKVVTNGEGKDVLIAYSLGNYISSLTYKNANVELILNINIEKASDSDKAVLKTVNYTPIYVLDNGTKATNRYTLEDMKKLATDYAGGDTSKINRKTYNEIVEKLKELNKLVNGE